MLEVRFTSLNDVRDLNGGNFEFSVFRLYLQLPVVDGEQRPLGVMDVTDLVGMEVAEEPAPSFQEETQKRPPAVRLFAEESEA